VSLIFTELIQLTGTLVLRFGTVTNCAPLLRCDVETARVDLVLVTLFCRTLPAEKQYGP